MQSQPPPTHPPRYPPPPQMPSHLAHVVNTQYAHPHPHHMSGVPLPVPLVPHHTHHLPPPAHHLPSPAPHHNLRYQQPVSANSTDHHVTETAPRSVSDQPQTLPQPQHPHVPSALSQPPISQNHLQSMQHPPPQPHLPSIAHTHPHSTHASAGSSPPQGLPSTHYAPYYDHTYSAGTKIAALEAELDKARQEIERLRLKLADYEKERAKTESPKVQSRYWTPNEHKRFLEALQKFGPKDVRAIANYVGSRNATQVRTHAQKYFLRVAREAKQGSALQAARKRSMSESDLARVGRSVRTPPGSPVMRENQQAPLFPPTSLPEDTPMTPAEHALPPAHGNGKMSTTSSSQGYVGGNSPKRSALRPELATAAKPPVSSASTTGGKPPVSGKLTDNTGINLLSLVASERKMEAEKGGSR